MVSARGKNVQQNPTEYEPTPAEKKILEVELNPENLHKTVTEKCRLAKVDRSTYYAAFKKPEFKALVKNLALELVVTNVLPTIHAVARESKRGSAVHNKMILEMANLYQEKQLHEVTGKDGQPLFPMDLSYLSDQELDSELRKYEEITEETIQEGGETTKRIIKRTTTKTVNSTRERAASSAKT